MSMRWSSRRTPYGTGLNHLPDMLTGEPWVRWPPAARLSPMKVSPGCISAKNTWFAWRRSAAGRWRSCSRTAWSRARSRASRRRRRTGSRRSSACPDSPRRTCWSAPSPAPRAPRALTMFSEAISSISSRWRPSSWPIASAISGSASCKGGGEEAVRKLRAVRTSDIAVAPSPASNVVVSPGVGHARQRRRRR